MGTAGFRRCFVWCFAAFVALAGCSAIATPPGLPAARVAGVADGAFRQPANLPTELLYALGGNPQTQSPHILVFDAQSPVSNPAPIYTIAPSSPGTFGLLAVDGGNRLFAVKYSENADKLYMYGAGATKPSVTCALPWIATSMYVANGLVYLAGPDSTIAEYAEPFHKRTGCGQPVQTLTDQRAHEQGPESPLYALVADPLGEVFDTWQGGRYNQMYMDRFPPKGHSAHAYVGLHGSYTTFYATADPNDNIITNLDDFKGTLNDVLAVFPHGSKVPKLFYPLGDGQYLGVALGTHDRELFALHDYPETAVDVYHYDPATGEIGAVKRSFAGLWYYDQTIAVYSP